MKVDLVNFFHAGDVILSRSIIQRVRPLLIDIVRLELRCADKYTYLWSDLGLPVHAGQGTEEDVAQINLWFGFQPDLLGVYGLSHLTQVVSYNRQASALGLPQILDEVPLPPPVMLSTANSSMCPGILVENGPVLSGQVVQDINVWLSKMAKAFPAITFYCASAPPRACPNLIDVSSMNLIELSVLSEVCIGMVSRLSGVFVASLTEHNRGRLPRFVVGSPIGCQIWDESDVVYLSDHEQLFEKIGAL